MIRVVLDTNILVSALLRPEGQPAAVWLIALSRGVQVCVSEPVLAEYEEVLRRPRLKILPAAITAALAALRQTGLWVKPTVSVQAATDPDDNIFLECAEEARAPYLVTGNTRHYPNHWKETQILTPREFLEAMTDIERGQT